MASNKQTKNNRSGNPRGTRSHRGISRGTPGNPRGTHPHPRGTLGEPIPGKPRGTVGVPKSQISIQISNLNSKIKQNQCFLLRFAISLLDVISTLAFCTFVFRKRFILLIKPNQTALNILDAKSHLICLNPKLPNSDCYEDTETHHMDVRLFVSTKPLPNCFLFLNATL
jgi:hypothetical protein